MSGCGFPLAASGSPQKLFQPAQLFRHCNVSISFAPSGIGKKATLSIEIAHQTAIIFSLQEKESALKNQASALMIKPKRLLWRIGSLS